MRAGLAAWLWIAAGGLLTAAYGCGPEFVAGTGGSGGDGGTGNTGGGGAGGAGGSGGTGGVPCVDADGDGVTDCDGDCDDGYALAYDGADEICDGADNDCDGQGDPSSCMGLGTFVAPDGDDANPGTRDQPLLTIAKGIENAELLGGATVYIAEGSYEEAVVLPPGVSLRGGHVTPTWEQDPGDRPSTIDCDAVAAYACVRAGAGVGRDNVIDGLTIRGAAGEPTDPPGSVALQLDSASPTITRCRILAGDVTGMIAGAERSIAVQILGQPSGGVGPRLEGNEIVGGDGPNDASIGVLIEAMAAAEIVNNDITSRAGQSSWGILDNGAVDGTEIVGNRIQAGDAAAQGVSFGIATRGAARIAQNFVNADQGDPPACADTVLWCGGIASYSSAARIENNVVFGAVAANSVALHLLEINVPALGDVHVNANYLNARGNASAAPARSAAIALGSPYVGASAPFAVIRNNILLGGLNGNRYGVYEENVGINQTCTPKAFTHNLIFFASGMSGVLYRQWNGTMETNIGVLANLPAEYTNNLNEDPLVDATHHLMTGSPCIDAGTHLDAPDVDFEGDQRPLANPVDIGPDEAQ